MSSILEIFFPLCAADPIHWQRRTPDVEHGIWSDVANEQLQQWLQTDAIRLYIPGEWISVWQVDCLLSPASRYRLFCPPYWKKN